MSAMPQQDTLFQNKSVLLFDLDGTLADSAISIILCHKVALRCVGIHAPKDNKDRERYVGPPMETIYGSLVPPQDVDKAIACYNHLYVTKGRMLRVAPFEGIRSMLTAFQAAGKTMCLATSKYATVAPVLLQKMGLEDFFSRIYATGPISETGDKTTLIAYALNDLGVKPEDVVMIGDRHHDIIGAKNNGVTSIGVRWGYAPEGELEEAGATRIAQTPQHLTDLILPAVRNYG